MHVRALVPILRLWLWIKTDLGFAPKMPMANGKHHVEHGSAASLDIFLLLSTFLKNTLRSPRRTLSRKWVPRFDDRVRDDRDQDPSFTIYRQMPLFSCKQTIISWTFDFEKSETKSENCKQAKLFDQRNKKNALSKRATANLHNLNCCIFCDPKKTIKMFLSSLLRKIGSGENKPAVPEIKAAEVKSDSVTITSVNLPSWKDRSMWSGYHLEQKVEVQCQEIKDTITGIWLNVIIFVLLNNFFSFY